jgi:hypothetical protein
MPTPFSENLQLVFKLLTLSGANAASELEVDKSVISRWLNGSVTPSAHNLTRLTAMVAKRVNGFHMLDWERDPRGLAQLFGVDTNFAGESDRGGTAAGALPIAIWDQLVAMSAFRGAAFQGFYRSTRPHPAEPGRFLIEHSIVRLNDIGLPRLRIGSGGRVVDGWMLPLPNQVYVIAADVTSGNILFAIFNDIGVGRIGAIDGIALFPLGRIPTATAMVCERIGDLSDDALADEQRFNDLVSQNPVAADDAVPEDLKRHLVRDIGPAQLPIGGDWLLKAPIERLMTRAAT